MSFWIQLAQPVPSITPETVLEWLSWMMVRRMVSKKPLRT
jgi:hypothetical protein